MCQAHVAGTRLGSFAAGATDTLAGIDHIGCALVEVHYYLGERLTMWSHADMGKCGYEAGHVPAEGKSDTECCQCRARLQNPNLAVLCSARGELRPRVRNALGALAAARRAIAGGPAGWVPLRGGNLYNQTFDGSFLHPGVVRVSVLGSEYSPGLVETAIAHGVIGEAAHPDDFSLMV
jgi:hypothetical protein